MGGLIDRLDDIFVEGWRKAHTWLTIQLHAAACAAAWAILEYSAIAPVVVKALPPEIQSHWVLRLVLTVWTVLVPLARLWKQKNAGAK
jgi:hypothetical protein